MLTSSYNALMRMHANALDRTPRAVAGAGSAAVHGPARPGGSHPGKAKSIAHAKAGQRAVRGRWMSRSRCVAALGISTRRRNAGPATRRRNRAKSTRQGTVLNLTRCPRKHVVARGRNPRKSARARTRPLGLLSNSAICAGGSPGEALMLIPLSGIKSRRAQFSIHLRRDPDAEEFQFSQALHATSTSVCRRAGLNAHQAGHPGLGLAGL
jgi:hypothetical protein